MRDPYSRLHLFLSRLLLALIAILLAVMPVTEHVLSFDRFLRGGQDFELTLLATLATFCLILLLAHVCRDSLANLIRRLLQHGPWISLAFPSGHALPRLAGRVHRLPAFPVCFLLPLKI